MRRIPARRWRPQGDPQVLLRQMFERLLDRFGPQGWWPAETGLEVILGAILVQNTTWQNAARGIARLRAEGMLSLRRLERATLTELEQAVRPAGFFRQKALTIRNFLVWLDRDSRGSLRRLFTQPVIEVRAKLLKLRGLGPETVDAILLYAGRKPLFPADAYTRRVMSRHGLVPETAGYAEVQEFLHTKLPPDPTLFNEFHALLVEAGKRHCLKEAPHCQGCPLEEYMPASEYVHSVRAFAGHSQSAPGSGKTRDGNAKSQVYVEGPGSL